jgi:hypothetical protein
MAISHLDGIAVSTISHINGVTKANVSAMNGVTASFGGSDPGGGPLPTVRGVGTNVIGTGAISPGLPTGTAENDILVLFLVTNNQAITVSGWTECGNSPQSDATDGIRLSVFWKRAGASEAAPTTSDSGTYQIGQIVGVVGGFRTGDPFDATNGGTAGALVNTMTIPGPTTTSANCLVLAAAGINHNGDFSGWFSGWTNAALGSITERMDQTKTSGAGAGGGFGVVSGTKATAGAVGNTTSTLVGGNTRRAVYWSGAIKPTGL